jgi:hypothetical protein
MSRKRVVIIGTHRSGTSNLGRALSLNLGLNFLGEPWNQNINRVQLGPGIEPFPFPNSIKTYSAVKTLVQHLPLDWTGNHMEFHKELTKQFDNVILLTRQNVHDMAVSYAKARETGHWHSEYTINNLDKLDLKIDFHQWCYQLILKVAETLNVPITWYELLYSGDKVLFNKEVDKWNIDIDRNLLFKHFNPDNRLRKFIKNKTTI